MQTYYTPFPDVYLKILEAIADAWELAKITPADFAAYTNLAEGMCETVCSADPQWLQRMVMN